MNYPRSIFTDPGSFKSSDKPPRSDPSPTRRVTNPETRPTTATDRTGQEEARPTFEPGTRPRAAPNGPVAGPFSLSLDGIRGRSVSNPEPAAQQAQQTSIQSPFKAPPPVTPPSANKKRTYEESNSNTVASEPTHKRLRLQPQRRLVLSHFNFQGPSVNHLEPPSPLFFSNSPKARPHLPARFSSSEAAARMLSKAKTEDSHVKTVSLARGTLPGSSMASAMSARASSDRSSAPRSASPDPAGKSDPSVSMISSIGVIELLEQDDRPTLIVDLGDSSNYGAGPLRPLFTNAALRSYGNLLGLLTGQREDDGTSSVDDEETKHSFLEFKAWLLSAAVNGESLNVCLPSFSFAGMSWSCSTLRKRLRLISGAFVAESTTPNAKSHFKPLPFQPPAKEPVPTVVTSSDAPREEPQDYFGSAALSKPPAVSRSVSGDALPTTESASFGVPSAMSMSRPIPDSLHSSNPLLMDKGFLAEPESSFDWTQIPVADTMPKHIQFARSVDWAATSLGPIEFWGPDLRQMCNLIMASPHPAAMYWGDDLVAIYNEAYILLAGQKHPKLMGQSYREAWVEIWDDVKQVFANARSTGEATMKDDDCLFINRNDYLEETYFSWTVIPMVGSDGSVKGLYNPAFEKTRRKIAERRMLTLREVGERTASARDVRAFWEVVLEALTLNEFDTPLTLLYSVMDDSDSDSSSIVSSSNSGNLVGTLEGALGVPEGHPAAPASIDLKGSNEGFGPAFREVMKTDKPVLIDVGSRDLPESLFEGLEKRGFGDPCRSVVICPIHPTTGESILGFLVLGINPRRPYDEDYSLFVQLLSRQLATSLASVVLFEEEIRRGQRAAKLAALDRMELSEQLAARTQEAIESETKFTRMAEFAPVGMFIANSRGNITYCNDTWFEISQIARQSLEGMAEKWMDEVKDEDKQMVGELWQNLLTAKKPTTSSFRFKSPWQDPDGTVGERWVLFSAYPEKNEDGQLKSIFGSFTDISKHKWAEGFQKRKMEEAVEMKRQQENFIDMTSHEMRNPLSAILQCADEISTTMTKFKDRLAINEKGPSTANGAVVKSGDTMDDSITSTLEAAQTIALCAQHQKRIVDDVLTLSKLDSQLLLVTPVDAQPLTVVQRALKMHEGELQSNDIQLKFVVEDSYAKLGIDWVRFDPSRVLQVLINLTTNAIKFTTTEQRRTITVSLAASKEKPSATESNSVRYFPSRQPDRADRFQNLDWGNGEQVFVQFAVQDTGRGLTPEEKKMLFLRFSQASPRTHVQYGGSGLGLFISRELTELQGGEIGVASEAGKGSTFAFYVQARRSNAPQKPDSAVNGDPKSAESATAATAAAITAATSQVPAVVPANAPSDQHKHILLVEDNLVNQRVLQRQLKNLGCTVHVANHGGEALDKLQTSTWWHSPGDKPLELSVVLMDQEMPVMDGLTATRKIRELEKGGMITRHIPVIAVTANARNEQVQTALDAGMDDVVSKPFRIPDLIPKIEELMGRYPEPDH